MVERRLGRGLGSLIPESMERDKAGSRDGRRENSPASESTEGMEPGSRLHAGPELIRTDSISPNPHQPRRMFEGSALNDLKSSISRHGVLQPIVLRAHPENPGEYQIISGERRWRACKANGLETIPAVVRDSVPEGEMLELALVENLQREDLDPIERAEGYATMMSTLGLTQQQVAERVGLKRPSISNHLRLLELPKQVQDAVQRGLLSMGHARALAGVKDESLVLNLLEEAVREDLSVRVIEERARAAAKAQSDAARGATQSTNADSAERESGDKEAWEKDLERRAEANLGARVRIQNGPDYSGTIRIDYYTRDELERIMEAIAPTPTL